MDVACSNELEFQRLLEHHLVFKKSQHAKHQFLTFDERWFEWWGANGTPKTLIPSNGVLNWDGVSKSGNKLEGSMLHIYKVRQKDLSHRIQF
jgi:hypothetical protein